MVFVGITLLTSLLSIRCSLAIARRLLQSHHMSPLQSYQQCLVLPSVPLSPASETASPCRNWWRCESPSWNTEPSLCCQPCSPPALPQLPPLGQHRCFLSGLLVASCSTAALSTSEGTFQRKVKLVKINIIECILFYQRDCLWFANRHETL